MQSQAIAMVDEKKPNYIEEEGNRLKNHQLNEQYQCKPCRRKNAGKKCENENQSNVIGKHSHCGYSLVFTVLEY